MSLDIEFLDRPGKQGSPPALWTMCSPGEMIEMRIRWLDHEAKGTSKTRTTAHLRYTVPYVGASADDELPTKVSLEHQAPTSEGLDVWLGTMRIPAPSFWPMMIAIRASRSHGEEVVHRSETVRVRILPRRSVMLASSLVIGSLVFIAFTATMTLSSLRLTATNTFTGLSAITILGFAAFILRTVGRTVWPRALPLLGIPYLLPRAVVAVVVGLCLAIIGLRTRVTTIYNSTKSDVGVSMLGRDREDVLSPGNYLSYAYSHTRVIDTLEGRIGDTFCVRDKSEPEPKIDPKDDECPPNDNAHLSRGWVELFSPPIIEVRCRRQYWPELTKEQYVSGSGVVLGTEAVWIEQDKKCKLQPAAIEVKVGELGDGPNGYYSVRYPWSLNNATSIFVRLAIDALPDSTLVVRAQEHDKEAPTEKSLDKETPDKETPDKAASTDAPNADKDNFIHARLSARGNHWKGGVLVPIDKLATSMNVTICSDSNCRGEVARLECNRPTPSADTHFRAVQLSFSGDTEAIVSIRAEGAQQQWTSTWIPTTESIQQPWICPVVPGSARPIDPPSRFGVERLRISIAEEELEKFTVIVVPSQWMAHDIELRAADGSPEEKSMPGAGTDSTSLGSLRCDATDISDVTIAALKLPTWVGERELTKLEVIVEDKSLAVSSSTWQATERSQSGEGSKWVWACWQGGGTHVTVWATIGASRHEGKLDRDTGKLDIQPPALRRCWLDEKRAFHEGPPDAQQHRNCRHATREEVRELLERRDTHCQHYEICVSPEAP